MCCQVKPNSTVVAEFYSGIMFSSEEITFVVRLVSHISQSWLKT